MCTSPAATHLVVGAQVPLEGDPGTAGEVFGQPARRLANTGVPSRRLTSADFHVHRGNPQGQAIRHATAIPAGEVRARQTVAALFRAAATQRYQRRKIAVAGAVLRQQHQLHAAGQLQFGAVDQLQRRAARRQMRAHAAGKAALVGDRQRRVAQPHGPRHEFLGVRSAAQEAEIGKAVEFGVGRQGGHGRDGGCVYIQSSAKAAPRCKVPMPPPPMHGSGSCVAGTDTAHSAR